MRIGNHTYHGNATKNIHEIWIHYCRCAPTEPGGFCLVVGFCERCSDHELFTKQYEAAKPTAQAIAAAAQFTNLPDGEGLGRADSVLAAVIEHLETPSDGRGNVAISTYVIRQKGQNTRGHDHISSYVVGDTRYYTIRVATTIFTCLLTASYLAELRNR